MDQNQPASPFHLSRLITPTLESTIRALSDRPGQTEVQRQARAHDTLTQIMSFQPRDVVDMTLAGQAVVFNELLADTARDVLRGVNPVTKARSLSAVLGMGRLTQGHLDRLDKRGNLPFLTEFVAVNAAAGEPAADQSQPAKPSQHAEPPAAEPPAAEPPAAEPPAAEPPPAEPSPAEPSAAEPSPAEPSPAEPPPAARPVQPVATQTVPAPEPPEPEPAEPAYQRPVRPESWLDEPYEQWVLETPALAAAAQVPAAGTKVTPVRDNGAARRSRAAFQPIPPASASTQMAAASGD